ncbi:hypothetical protein Ocin01_12494 [Orchesella cincta]|uniref:Uncharacterized protein n=1 Tax=Orchesella cincta TaxID=48709 RepID=A0A1D2MMB0_ORCCI|nr:hypothetical protein Ocin01_12494 [Orchesella cincta]
MKVFIVLAAVIAAVSAGYLGHHGYGGGHLGGHHGGYGHGHHGYAAVPVAVPVVHKVPVATSYHHEHRTYHPIVPVIAKVPVVAKVAVPVYPVHHGYGHAHGGHHGYGHIGYGGTSSWRSWRRAWIWTLLKTVGITSSTLQFVTLPFKLTYNSK